MKTLGNQIKFTMDGKEYDLIFHPLKYDEQNPPEWIEIFNNWSQIVCSNVNDIPSEVLNYVNRILKLRLFL